MSVLLLLASVAACRSSRCGVERDDAVGSPSPPPVRQASLEEPVSEFDLAPMRADSEIETLRSDPPDLTRLHLDQIIAMTLENDPVIRASIEMVWQAEAERIEAGLLPNPTVEALVSLLPLRRRFMPQAEGGPPQMDVFAEYPVDWFLFGKRLAAIEAARRGIDVADAEAADIVRLRAADTTDAFYELMAARAMLQLAELDVTLLERVEGLVSQLVELEEVAPVELDRVRLEVLAARREQRNARIAAVAAKAQLQALMGWDRTQGDFELEGRLNVEKPLHPITAEEALHLAMRNRPDLIALQRRIDQAAAVADVQRREAWPEVAMIGGFSRQYQRQALDMPDADSWGAGVVMSIPLFDRNQGGRRMAASEWRQAQLEYRAGVLEIQAEIREAVESFQQAWAIATTEAPAQFEAARSVLDRIEQAYRSGDRSLLEVLDAQQAFREINRLYIEGQLQYWQSLNQLNRAVGLPIHEVLPQ